jgi:hypothetical protein
VSPQHRPWHKFNEKMLEMTHGIRGRGFERALFQNHFLAVCCGFTCLAHGIVGYLLTGHRWERLGSGGFIAICFVSAQQEGPPKSCDVDGATMVAMLDTCD